MNELIKTEKIEPKDVFKPMGLEPILQDVKKQIDAFKPDPSTQKGRDEIKSFCYKIKRSKTFLDEIGKKYVAELKELPKLVDGERKRMRDQLDEWEDKTRAPLTKWEKAEEDRKNSILSRINAIDPFLGGITTITVEDYSLEEFHGLLAKAQDFVVDSSLQEFEGQGAHTKSEVTLKLEGLIAKKTKIMEEQAELARLRKEQEARERQEREERIAREAAEQARLQAEAKAKADAEKAEQARLAAVQAKEEAERKAKEAEEKAKRDMELVAQREREKIEAEKRQAEQEAAKREANKQHFAKINNEAAKAITLIMADAHSGNIVEAEKMAKAIITAIAKKQIPHVTITY